MLLRALRRGDAVKLSTYFNAIVDEDTFITHNTKESLRKERICVCEHVRDMRKKKQIHIVAVFGKRIVAYSDIRRKIGKQAHAGELGIMVAKDFRNEGMGTILLQEMIRLAKEALELKVLSLTMFANNSQAQHVYEKLGFRVCGAIPKEILHRGKYVDGVLMVMEL